jgi:hypothetical protein
MQHQIASIFTFLGLLVSLLYRPAGLVIPKIEITRIYCPGPLSIACTSRTGYCLIEALALFERF